MKKLSFRQLGDGFTLIELMIVVSVIAILSTLSFWGVGKMQAAARDVQRQQIVNAMRAALENYYGNNSYTYPASAGVTLSTVLTDLGYTTMPSDPGCGSTANPVNGGSITSTSWCPCATGGACAAQTLTTTEKAGYMYTRTAGGYQIDLKKESASALVSFTNPQ